MLSSGCLEFTTKTVLSSDSVSFKVKAKDNALLSGFLFPLLISTLPGLSASHVTT